MHAAGAENDGLHYKGAEFAAGGLQAGELGGEIGEVDFVLCASGGEVENRV